MRLRLGLTFYSVFYAPYYVALNRGLFVREGLDLEVVTLGNGELVMDGLTGGTLDAGIGGIMRSLVGYDRGMTSVPIHVARINDRDGFFLLGRDPSFDWPDLIGRRLLLFSEAPTPWYVLRAFLIDRGLDPDGVQVIAGLPADQAAAAFRRGEADFLETPAHVAEELLRDGAAVLLRSMAEEAGALPYSSYCVRPEFLATEPAVVAALIRAHIAALAWLRTADGADIWEVIRPSFPDGDPEVLARAVERYHRLGVWSSDAALPRSSYDRLAGMLQRGGLITRVAPYELVCRDDLTRQALGLAG
jgi:NitT/TauT family transport system substrate-binding protein